MVADVPFPITLLRPFLLDKMEEQDQATSDENQKQISITI